MKRRDFLGIVSVTLLGMGSGALSSTAEAKDKVRRDMKGRQYVCKWKKTGARKWSKRKWIWVKRKECKWVDQ